MPYAENGNSRMRAQGCLGSALMLAIGAPVLGMLLAYAHTYRARYRTTVVVQTPEGLTTGSAVRKVAFGPGLNALAWLLGEHHGWEISGQAVVINLPKGQSLFLIVDKPAEEGITVRDGDKMQGGHWQLWPNPPVSDVTRRPYRLPLMLHFKDINDPRTVEEVNPSELAASFGPGYSLKSVTQETVWPWTTVTSGIETKLRWLPILYDITNPYHHVIFPPNLKLYQTIRQSDFNSVDQT